MTQNEIAYWELQRQREADAETKRANQAREAENYRSNLAKETETNRSNVAQETETARSNLAREQETGRSNLAKETETNRSNMAREKETKRHNQATELISGAGTGSQILNSPLGRQVINSVSARALGALGGGTPGLVPIKTLTAASRAPAGAVGAGEALSGVAKAAGRYVVPVAVGYVAGKAVGEAYKDSKSKFKGDTKQSIVTSSVKGIANNAASVTGTKSSAKKKKRNLNKSRNK